MSETPVLPGVPFTESMRNSLKKSYPTGTISLTHGRKESLSEEMYLVRGGERAVIMPRMNYSESVEAALKNKELP